MINSQSNNMEYQVQLKSADNNLYEITLEANNKKDAEILAMTRINDKGWSQYNYKIFRTTEIKG